MSKIKSSWNNFKAKVKENGVKHYIWVTILGILIAGASLCLLFALYIIISAPNFDKDVLYKKEASIIYYADGTELARIGRENRELVNYSDLPQVYVDALLATEDSRFFQHNGLDIARFLKASFKQLIGSNEGGASTLTMQLVKNNYTSNNAKGIQGIIRKFTDIYMAVFKIENSYTKEEIIEFYVNTLWLAHDGNVNYSGIYGVEMASQYYFGKSISEVSLAEASLLVGMYQNAVLYNPYRNPEGCRNRQRTVLKLMVNHGYITEEEKDAVLAIPIQSLLATHEDETTGEADDNQIIIDYVTKQVEEETGKNPSYTSMQIYTTIDKNIQDTMNLLEEGKLVKWCDDMDQEGTAVTSVENGSIIALSAGRNYEARSLDRATDVKRAPGSTVKPIFDYGPYIEYLNGSTGDYFFDNPYTYSNGTPIKDADNGYQGMITMRQALVGSRNITALQAFQKVMATDSSLIPNLVHKFGIDYGDALYESASIGGFTGITPLEMSAAYAVFGRGGYYIEPYIFTKVIYDDGTTYEYKPKKEKIISEETAYMITSMLMDTARSDYGMGASFGISGTQLATKTGTTTIDDSAISQLGVPAGTIPDSWIVTYSPEYSIALWYGYDVMTPEYNMDTNQGWTMRTYLMQSLARRIFSINKTFSRPSGVVSVEVERNTIPLQLPSEFTPANMRMTELFKEGTEPAEVSTRYQKLPAPKNGNYTLVGDKVTLTWDEASTPNAIDSDYLKQQYNNNYGSYASQYYDSRVNANASEFGDFGYQVYLQKEGGTLTDLGWFSTNTYTQSVEPGHTYNFVIKSAYSNFKENASNGLTISVTVKGTPKPDNDDKPTRPTNPDKPIKPNPGNVTEDPNGNNTTVDEPVTNTTVPENNNNTTPPTNLD